MAKKNEQAKYTQNRYICYDCSMVFQVFGVMKGIRSRSPFCPSCGENHSTEREKEKRKRSNDERTVLSWQDAEYDILFRIIDGELTPSQGQIMTGRSLSSIYSKLSNVRKELKEQGRNEKNG